MRSGCYKTKHSISYNQESCYRFFSYIFGVLMHGIKVIRSRPAGINMYLLTEWEGRTGKYLARGQDVRTDKHFIILPFFFFFHFHFFFWWNEDTRISSRAICVFPVLSPRRVRPSTGTFFPMVFQGNCARGRTGHMIKPAITHLTSYRNVEDTASIAFVAF